MTRTATRSLLVRMLSMTAVVAAVAFLAPDGLLDEVMTGLRNVRLHRFVPLLLLQLATLGLIGVQWTILLRKLSPAVPVRWSTVMRRYLGGSLVESLTPSAKLGGEAARIALFRHRFGIPAGRLAGAAAQHKLAMTVGLLLVLGAAAVGVPSLHHLLHAAAGTIPTAAVLQQREPVLNTTPREAMVVLILSAAVLTAGAAIVARGAERRLRAKRLKKRLPEAMRLRAEQPSTSTDAQLPGSIPRPAVQSRLTAIAVVVWILYPTKVALAAYAVGVNIAPGTVFAATYGAYLLGLLPLTPGGLGFYEAGMAGILVAGGVAPADAALVTVVSRIVTFWWPLLLSLAAGAGLLLQPAHCHASPAARKHRCLQDRLLAVVVWLENLGAGNRVWGWLYTRLFYRNMNRHEYEAAQLLPGKRVLQLGCGPFPMTAIALSQHGCHVTAVDCNQAALDTAQRALERSAAHLLRAGTLLSDGGVLPGAVTFRRACGLEYSYQGFDAVIVALHVCPKLEILKRILDTADPGTRIVYRNPRGLLCRAYHRITPGDLGLAQVGQTAVLPGNKELVVLQKPEDYMTAREIATAPCAACMLCDLTPRQCGVIEHAPEIPALAALGLRPGKTCSLIAAQPWGGPIICSVGGRQVALERSIAQQIGIRRDIGQS